MNIWIVEDNETDALKAAIAVVAAIDATPEITRSSTKLYWEPTLHWKPRLYRIPIAKIEPNLSDREPVEFTAEVAPTVVVLDLLDNALVFEAEHFLSALRTWEVKQNVSPCFVVIWSVRSGRQEVRTFIDGEPQRDWRVKFLGTKDPVALTRAVRGYLHTELELKYQ